MNNKENLWFFDFAKEIEKVIPTLSVKNGELFQNIDIIRFLFIL